MADKSPQSQARDSVSVHDLSVSDRVFFEAKRPNGDQVEFGLPKGRLDVVFTVDGPIKVKTDKVITEFAVSKKEPHRIDFVHGIEATAKKAYERIVKRQR